MKLSEFKTHLALLPDINFIQLNGQLVPPHFHITEAGLTSKHFIDCGGTIRTEKCVNLQVWVANDLNHRLTPAKLLGIIDKATPLFSNEDLEVEIEYQGETIGRYGINHQGNRFQLTAKNTDCLAKAECGIDANSLLKTATINNTPAGSCCTPGGGCC